jgi:uncharacterized protein YndB with AHSA1/START domain
MAPSTDRIEKQITLRAPLERVWHAISDASAFGRWFGVAFDGPFVAGARLTGRIVPTTVDAEVAKAQAPYTGLPFECLVERIEPPRHFSFRWHPFAVDPRAHAAEPMTLVAFELEAVPSGTRLTITESGFDQLPAERRAIAFAQNEGGWAAQVRLIDRFLQLEAAS